MSRYLLILCALSVVKGLPFHQNPMGLMMKDSNIGGYDQMALHQTPEYQLITGKLHEVLSRPEVVKILKNQQFKEFIDPKNLIKKVHGDQFKMLMNSETESAMMKTPLFANIISSPEMKTLIKQTGMGPYAPKLGQIIPLLLEVYRERVKSKIPLPGPVEEFGQRLGLIPPAELLEQAERDAEVLREKEAARIAAAVAAARESKGNSDNDNSNNEAYQY